MIKDINRYKKGKMIVDFFNFWILLKDNKNYMGKI